MPANSYLYPVEPNWITNRPGTHQRIPASAQSWIYEPDSLTRRLKAACGNTFSVRVLFHQWKKPFLSERKLLGLSDYRYCLIREVLLVAGNTPLILARTIIPAETLTGAQRNLSRLGNRPLGEVIFSYPQLQRLEMDIALVAPHLWDQSVKQHIDITESLWGRRTVYAIKQHQLLVSEFFLPGVLGLE